MLPQSCGKSSAKDLGFSHDRDPAVTQARNPVGSSGWFIEIPKIRCQQKVTVTVALSPYWSGSRRATMAGLVGEREQGAASRVAGDQGDVSGRLRAQHTVTAGGTERFRARGVGERRRRGVEGTGCTTGNRCGCRYSKFVAALS